MKRRKINIVKDEIDNELDQIKKYEELAAKIRATFLEQAISIDSIISDIISTHFCYEEEKRAQLFSLISNYITFSIKIKILNELLKFCYPDIIKKLPKIRTELNEIRKFRNRIVHSQLDSFFALTKKQSQDGIRVIYYENGEKKYWEITKTDINIKLRKSSIVGQMLCDVKREIISRNT